jgi:hypothetical protein
MPGAVMHTRTVTGGLIALALCLTAGFAACGRPSEPLPPTALVPRSAAAAGSVALSPGSAIGQPAESPGPSSSDAGTSTPDAMAAAVAQARACDAPLSVIANQPDGGTVFNNAMTSADAGHIDRTAGVLEAIAGQAAALRCCFDVWGAQSPTKEGRLVLVLTLAPDGAVRDTAVDAARTDILDPVTVGCVLAVAKSTTFPASPTGRETIVEYPFVVRSGR